MLPRSARMALFAPLVSLVCVAEIGGCAQGSPPVVAPTLPPGSVTSEDAGVPDATPTGDAADGPQAEGTAPARFRACTTDAECVAVPRVGCCHNGWNEAVAASQKDAYATSFTCPDPHPMCVMMIVRDTRVPRCDGSTHLCGLVAQ
jgi:hypothetical protein